MRSAGSTDADASTRSASGGAINVATFNASVDTNPSISVSVGDSAHVTAGTITVDATHNTTTPEYSDGSFHGTTGVDTGDGASGNRITFSLAHGLSSGQLITYENNGTTSIGGLTDGRSYSVLVPVADTGVDPSRSLQLGSVFDGSAVDSATDEIRFAGEHGLVSGDRVLYYPGAGSPTITGLTSGSAYLVNVIDARTIKLKVPGEAAPSTTVPASSVGTNIVNVANDFVNATPITYRDLSGLKFTSGALELVTKGTNSNEPQLTAAPANDIQYNTAGDWIFLGRNPDADGKYTTGHGFNTGDAVYYARTGGNLSTLGPAITSNTVYYVIKVDDYRFQLAATRPLATGDAGPGPDGIAGNADDPADPPVTRLALIPDRSAAGLKVVHSIYANNEAPLTGLVDGQVYFAKSVDTPTNNTFQLAATPGGAAISFSAGGRTGGSHRFEFEGLNLAATGNGVQTLVFDLTAQRSSTPAGGTATRQLVQAGYHAVNLTGGMIGWQRAGFPSQRGK